VPAVAALKEAAAALLKAATAAKRMCTAVKKEEARGGAGRGQL
jgi:hypothetical protein